MKELVSFPERGRLTRLLDPTSITRGGTSSTPSGFGLAESGGTIRLHWSALG
jgi:hypothetical protein